MNVTSFIDIRLLTSITNRETQWGGNDWINLAQDGTSVRLFWTQYWTFGFHRCWGILEYLSNCGFSLNEFSVMCKFFYIINWHIFRVYSSSYLQYFSTVAHSLACFAYPESFAFNVTCGFL
jgi:hypothetical protein